jgi:hypothetical protein
MVHTALIGGTKSKFAVVQSPFESRQGLQLRLSLLSHRYHKIHLQISTDLRVISGGTSIMRDFITCTRRQV